MTRYEWHDTPAWLVGRATDDDVKMTPRQEGRATLLLALGFLFVALLLLVIP